MEASSSCATYFYVGVGILRRLWPVADPRVVLGVCRRVGVGQVAGQQGCEQAQGSSVYGWKSALRIAGN